MRKTKIVCTLGPASNSKEVFTRLVQAGLNVARFNFSHGDHTTHKKTMDMVKEVREELGVPIALMLDTKGPEIRVKTVKENTILVPDEDFVLTCRDVVGDEHQVSITYEQLHEDLKVGDLVLIDDGLIVLRVKSIENGDITTTIVHGGELKTKKGVNAPGIRVNLPAITKKDEEDIVFGIEQGIDYIAASFIRKPEDVLRIRQVLEDHNAKDIQIISKIENQEGYDNLDAILKVSDGIMVARGDLGVEIPISEVPIAQKRMIEKCNRFGKPVITATQMLDSMIRNPSPTRAEATDVANAIFDGTDAIMLSGETAAGQYPEDAVRTMSEIAMRAESTLNYDVLFAKDHDFTNYDRVTIALSRAVVEAANNLDAKAILTATSSGFTASRAAMFRPRAAIIAGTYSEKVRRKLALVRGVYPVILSKANTTDEVFMSLEQVAKESGYIHNGDLAVISAGVPIGVAGTTNLMKIQVLGSVILKATGIGHGNASGKLHILKKGEPVVDFEPGDILYASSFNETHSKLMQQAGGLISAEGGYTSFAAVAGVHLGIPTVVGINQGNDLLENGMMITVDADRGIVHNSQKYIG